MALKVYTMGIQSRYDNGSHPLMLAGLRAARGKITISGIENCLNFK